jgi:hypothetical protein
MDGGARAPSLVGVHGATILKIKFMCKTLRV